MLADPAPAPTPQTPAGEPSPEAARLRELEVLRRLAVQSVETVHADELFRLVCAASAELLGNGFALLSLPMLDTPLDWCGGAEPPREAVSRLLELLELARSEGETVLAGEAEGAAGVRVVPAPYASATAIAFPVVCEERGGALLLGWLGSRALGAETLRVAGELAQQAGVAFRNVIRYQKLAQTAVKRERFFSAMSHDLRTPITAIMGYSELLQDGIMGDLEPHQHDMVERICQVSGHLAELVNDVLDIAKLDAGRMEFHREPVKLGDLADEALLAVEPQARAKGLELRRELEGKRDTELVVDTSRVRQVLVNLLSNAVKFTEQGWVSLSADTAEGRLCLHVADSGPGLPEGSEETVFEEFLQIASGTKAKSEPGSGLGLAIARKLVQAMGGELFARKREEGGAVFTVMLPDA